MRLSAIRTKIISLPNIAAYSISPLSENMAAVQGGNMIELRANLARRVDVSWPLFYGRAGRPRKSPNSLGNSAIENAKI